jgi:hypothetical protein
MLRHTFTRTVLGAVLAAALLVPAAQADSWARDGHVALDPAIATAIQDHAAQLPASVPLDPAIANAISDRSTSELLALDPAIQTAMLDRTSSPTRPDDRAAVRGVGSLTPPVGVAPDDGFDGSTVGIGAAAFFGALLLACGSLLAVRHGRTRVSNA